MTFSVLLHKELLWDFSFGVLGHGIITIEGRSSFCNSVSFRSCHHSIAASKLHQSQCDSRCNKSEWSKKKIILVVTN